MDIKAIAPVTDCDLSRLGITAKGDILALRAFCAKSEAPTTNVGKRNSCCRLLKRVVELSKINQRMQNQNFVILVLRNIVQAKKSMYIGGMVAPDSIGLHQMQPSMISLILGNQNYL